MKTNSSSKMTLKKRHTTIRMKSKELAKRVKIENSLKKLSKSKQPSTSRESKELSLVQPRRDRVGIKE
ncbi:hypothetical protein AKJ16_DCAP05181 [Drosera capensis]